MSKQAENKKANTGLRINGRAFVFGDHVNTDEIIPARYLNTSDAQLLALHVMEDSRPGFGGRADIAGGIIVAGKNFGCGSSREHAPLAIKSAGIACVVAQSFARIFKRNAVNIGLSIVEIADTQDFQENDTLAIDLAAGQVTNQRSGVVYVTPPYPPFLQQVIGCGGWLAYAAQEMKHDTEKTTQKGG